MMLDALAHPMVVKELRQGLKSRTFAAGLMILQLLLVLCMVLYLSILHSNTAGSGDLEDADFVFWAAVGAGMLVLIPLRAIFSVSHERVQGTLELLYLTPLSCRGIIRGKNLVLVVQALLFFSTAMPYMVMRYFFGAFDTVLQISIAALVLGGSVFMIGGGVWISTFEGKGTRITLSVTAGLFCLISGAIVLEEISFGGGPGLPGMLLGMVFLMTYGAYFVEAGAARIATMSENHTPMQRKLSVAVFLLAAAGGLWAGDGAWMVLAMFLLLPMFIAALCERAHPLKSLHAPKTHLPAFHGWFFTPGWFSSTLSISLFTLVLLLLTFFGELLRGGFSDDEIYALIVIFHNLAIFPVFLMQFRKIKMESRMIVYLIVMFVSLVFGLFCIFLVEVDLLPDTPLRAFLPPMSLIHAVDAWGEHLFLENLFAACVFSFTLLAKNASRPGLLPETGGQGDV